MPRTLAIAGGVAWIAGVPLSIVSIPAPSPMVSLSIGEILLVASVACLMIVGLAMARSVAWQVLRRTASLALIVTAAAAISVAAMYALVGDTVPLWGILDPDALVAPAWAGWVGTVTAVAIAAGRVSPPSARWVVAVGAMLQIVAWAWYAAQGGGVGDLVGFALPAGILIFGVGWMLIGALTEDEARILAAPA
ncbi:MAG TPA: hypothetical protein VFM19_04295 [Candidatus Limnocylindria bacterium]|nr:hypothetical protein [Candidatus Limnocylindria bacterium]